MPGPRTLAPLATVEFIVERDNVEGGSGANFIVEWMAREKDINPPLIEAVMVGIGQTQSFSFVRTGQVLRDRDR